LKTTVAGFPVAISPGDTVAPGGNCEVKMVTISVGSISEAATVKVMGTPTCAGITEPHADGAMNTGGGDAAHETDRVKFPVAVPAP